MFSCLVRLEGSDVKRLLTLEDADVSATQVLRNRDVNATQVLINRESLSSTEREHVLNFLLAIL